MVKAYWYTLNKSHIMYVSAPHIKDRDEEVGQYAWATHLSVLSSRIFYFF